MINLFNRILEIQIMKKTISEIEVEDDEFDNLSAKDQDAIVRRDTEKWAASASNQTLANAIQTAKNIIESEMMITQIVAAEFERRLNANIKQTTQPPDPFAKIH